MIFEKLFCGLDIGSQRIKTSLVKISRPDKVELMGVFDAMTRGVKDYSVTDLVELSESIQYALGGLAKRTGVRLKDVHVGISGHMVTTKQSHATIALLDGQSKIITNRDIKKVNKNASIFGTTMDECVLHHFPLRYFVDDNQTAVSPLGLHGYKLESHLLLIISKRNLLNNVTRAVNQAGFEVSKISFSPFLASQVILNKKQKKDGCVYVNIGASSTDIFFFKDDYLRQVKTISVGGDHITASLAKVLHLSFDLAEDIKKSYAVAIKDETRVQEEILVKKGSSYSPIKKDVIWMAVESPIHKMVSEIHNTLQSADVISQVSRGVIVGGAASLLPGLIERLERNMEIPVKMGKIMFSTHRLKNPAIYAGAVGLAWYGDNQRILRNAREKRQPGGIKFFLNRIEELYHEYF